MTKFQIDYFELPTTRMVESQRFFAEAFGFSKVEYGPDYSEITGAGVLGGLSTDVADLFERAVIGVRTDDITAAVAAVEAAGGEILRPVYDYPGGQRCVFREPGGNLMLLYCPAE